MAAGLLWEAVHPKATEDLTQLSVRCAGLHITKPGGWYEGRGRS